MEKHTVNIDNRHQTVVTEVEDVDGFNDENIVITLKDGGLFLKGKELHIQRLDLAEGKVIVAGRIDSLEYTAKKENMGKSFFKRLLK